MSNILFCSDNHFGHANIIKYSNRPFADVHEMDEAMIKNWNNHVNPNDTVYNLGDFSFHKYDKTCDILRRLNGNKHLILGNHDKDIIKNTRDLLNKKLFNSIQYYYELKTEWAHIVLFHFGCRVWNKSHKGSILLFGHSHNSLPPHGKSVDVGVDSTQIVCAAGLNGQKTKDEYRPIHLGEVLKYMSKREIAVVDHHGDRE